MKKEKNMLLVSSARAVPYAKVYHPFFNQYCEEVFAFLFHCFCDAVFGIGVIELILGPCQVTNQVTGFDIKCNTGLKWVNPIRIV